MISQHILTVFVVVLTLMNPSRQMSVRRQLDSLPSAMTTTNADGVREPEEESVALEGSLLESSPQHHQEVSSARKLDGSSQDMATINEILNLLNKTVGDQQFNQNLVLDTLNGDLTPKESSLATDLLTTGHPKVDELLADLGQPSANSRAVWMALLHGLMSDGSLNGLLGNFVQESPSAKREGQFPGQVLEGQGQLREEQFVDQLEGPIPQTQIEEFILEPHLGPAIMPFEVPEGIFVSFLPRRAFGVVNGVSRPAHGHGSFYIHRPPGLVDVINPPAYGFLFNSYRRFQPDAIPLME